MGKIFKCDMRVKNIQEGRQISTSDIVLNTLLSSRREEKPPMGTNQS